jgi:hypothetical protein
MTFGPEYTKIETLWKRAPRSGLVIPGEFSLPEFEYLAELSWRWTEKINGMNMRLRWDGSSVTVGGRTDGALLPATLCQALVPLTSDIGRWHTAFPWEAADVTVCCEGYGAGIHGGGKYRPDQAVIVFDVRVDEWWLRRDDIEDVAANLGLDVVPSVGTFSLYDAWALIAGGHPSGESFTSAWPGVLIEGIVGKPEVELRTRDGSRLITKIKTADYVQLERAKMEAGKRERESPPSGAGGPLDLAPPKGP